ncbi:SDR family oxidoreductase [Stygiobacter electus]|uniref:NAD(P)-dependent oxidoreductase n=1 Tax=Stygiobacter electus TaxID=3032292 RepID=A0AAE3P1H9_9BACT|nr:NAD(P)-dependent oxidoreductase [Stygiobacter electus]MDF1612354.1 NAD(P)-dependent oxidoreductase [Stygiobacter electus]
MKIFITGGSGFIGQYLNIELSKENEILTQYYSHIGNCTQFNSIKCSITDYALIEKIFNEFKPEIVIHTASISTAEKADKMNPAEVYEINVNATKFLAEQCEKHNSKLIYFSTDLVYAGYRGSYLKEDAKLIPISLYAETKLMGEVKIQETFDNYLILRVALNYGLGLYHSSSHFQKIYEELKKGNEVKLFTDQYRSPISVIESARILSQIIKMDIRKEIINFAGKERLSRYQLGEKLCEVIGFNKELLKPITMEEANAIYPVADVSLNVDKLLSYGIDIKSTEESIKEIIKYFK